MPPLLKRNGKPAFLLGVNYWSKAGGPRMWEKFDEKMVRRELDQMRAIGLNTCRSFAFLPSFMPQPPILSTSALVRFRSFLDLCHGAGMSTIPSFLVGHMSGENFDFPGQNGRSPYTDAEVLGWEKDLIRGLATIGEGHPSVIAYLASNEMPLWGGASDPATISAWAKKLREALREKDAHRPFGLGDGVMNLKGGQNGFDVESLRDTVDFFGPHTYYGDIDPLRQALNAEYCIRSLSYLGLPILFEEFGGAAGQMSEQNQTLYFREVIHACLSAGAAGALGWCYADFSLDNERPYQHHAFELNFGIVRADGSEKPVCQELRRISKLIDVLDVTHLKPPQPQAAILVPSYFNTNYPFSTEDRERMRRTLLQAYVLAVGAGLETELIPEGTDLSPYRLVIAPSTQKLLAPTWRALLEHARRGNTIYWSYFAGDYNYQRSFWCQIFTELTGCNHDLRYGCYDLPEEEVTVSGAGLTLQIKTNIGQPYPKAYLPIVPQNADVLARDQRGRPSLIRTRQQQGQVFFLNYPWEYYLAEQVSTNHHSSATALYRLLSKQAGISPTVHSSDPRVQTRIVGTNGAPLLWVMNHSWETISTEISSPGGQPLYEATKTLTPGSTLLELAPKQIAIYQMNYDQSSPTS